jgi:predicted N-formylglutamate amidohydrolase
MADFFLITCEHGGNDVPLAYRPLFHGLQDLLNTHRGFDFGALLMAQALSSAFQAPLVTSTVTRLLVDLNRSVGHPRLHVEAVRNASAAIKEDILATHYRPYRAQAEHWVKSATAQGHRVIHLSAHSFTPVLDGQVRTADVGLLYDPARAGEVALCAQWKAALQAVAPHLRVRRNYPYIGTGDGFMPYLRQRYPAAIYTGIEIEINQALVIGSPRRWIEVRAAIVESLRAALAPSPTS